MLADNSTALLKIRARVGPVLIDDARVREVQIEGWHAEVERVYREHSERLWKALLLFSRDRDVASDAVAEAFTQALARGDEIRTLPGWVWRTAFRVAAGELKARQRDAGAAEEMSYEMTDPLSEVMEGLKRLSPKQRGAVVLHYYVGYPIVEIARIIGSTPAAVGIHLHRGRNRLRKFLEEEGD
jgi:RNA polymerase sigma-70 factor (ECF subfamily)